MLYREIIADYSEIHTKHINTLCGLNVELLSVKPGVTLGFKGSIERNCQRLKQIKVLCQQIASL